MEKRQYGSIHPSHMTNFGLLPAARMFVDCVHVYICACCLPLRSDGTLDIREDLRHRIKTGASFGLAEPRAE